MIMLVISCSATGKELGSKRLVIVILIRPKGVIGAHPHMITELPDER